MLPSMDAGPRVPPCRSSLAECCRGDSFRESTALLCLSLIERSPENRLRDAETPRIHSVPNAPILLFDRCARGVHQIRNSPAICCRRHNRTRHKRSIRHSRDTRQNCFTSSYRENQDNRQSQPRFTSPRVPDSGNRLSHENSRPCEDCRGGCIR